MLHTTDSAVMRRLYDIRNEVKKITTAELAGALLDTCNIDLDRDTDIPTLPTRKIDAFDLLWVRASALDPQVDPRSLVPLVPDLLHLALAIVESPELTAHLQDDAPFNCLRAWSKL